MPFFDTLYNAGKGLFTQTASTLDSLSSVGSKASGGSSFLDTLSLGSLRQHPDRYVTSFIKSPSSLSKQSQDNLSFLRALEKQGSTSAITSLVKNGGLISDLTSQVKDSSTAGSSLVSTLASQVNNSTSSSSSLGGSLVRSLSSLSSTSLSPSKGSASLKDVISRAIPAAIGANADIKDPSTLDKIINYIKPAIYSMATQPINMMQIAQEGIKAATQAANTPSFKIALGAIALFGIIYPRSEKFLRNININIRAEDQPTTYVIGIGQQGRERRVALQISAGTPVQFVPEPGVKMTAIYNGNHESSTGTTSSVGFSSILGFLNVLTYYKKQKMTVYNVIVSDPKPSGYLRAGPRVNKINLSDCEVLQVIQVCAADKSQVFKLLATKKPNQKVPNTPKDIDHVQLVNFNVNNSKFIPISDSVSEKVVNLPAFDKKTDEFVRITAHKN